MSTINNVILENLGDGFSSDAVAQKINVALTVETKPLYEYRDLWAAEGSRLNAGTAEWSYGNGETGFIGIPFDEDWEVVQMAFSADTHAATASVQVDLMNYNTPSNAASNTISSIRLANAADGGGATNNSRKVEVFDPPIKVPAGKIGFITRALTGNISDARVYARFRRQIGDYVSSVEPTPAP